MLMIASILHVFTVEPSLAGSKDSVSTADLIVMSVTLKSFMFVTMTDTRVGSRYRSPKDLPCRLEPREDALALLQMSGEE